MSLLEDLDDAPLTEDLRAQIRRLERSLAKAKDKQAGMVDAVYQAMHDAVTSISLPAVPNPPKDRRTKKADEVAVPILSDWQLAKITPSYDSQTAEKRVALFADKVIELTEIQRADHPVKTATVVCLGDLVEGEMIFPGQEWLIDSSLYRQVTHGAEILVDFVRRMLANFDTVHVVAVIGNHGAIGGRARRNMHPESNADRMLYRTAELLLRDEPRVTWQIPEYHQGDRGWYAHVSIGRFSALAVHGDQFRGGGYGGLPYYSFFKKTLGWKSGAIPVDFDEVWCGHWHQPARITLNTVTLRVAGSTESYNTYAQEMLAAVGKPSQPLLFVSPEHGRVTAEYTVWL